MPANFHARFDATGKQYRYMIWNHPVSNPLTRHTSWHVSRNLDLADMQKAAKYFIGKHDFSAFAVKREYEMRSTVRVVTNCKFYKKDSMLTCVIEGEGFLYKMCRGIVGTLIEVGTGKLKPIDIQNILKSCDRSKAGMTAPAHGLILWKVKYSKNKVK